MSIKTIENVTKKDMNETFKYGKSSKVLLQ